MCANAKWEVIAYTSRQLKKHKQNYHTHDSEMSAVVLHRKYGGIIGTV